MPKGVGYTRAIGKRQSQRAKPKVKVKPTGALLSKPKTGHKSSHKK